MSRIDGLDYLRGIAATGIMLYHFFTWSGYFFSAGDFLGKTGIYGVAVFYVLSGLTLHIVYSRQLTCFDRSLVAFAIKRIFRIFPLLWLVTIGTIIISKQTYST